MTAFGSVGATLLFGLAANADNLTVGIAYGIKRRWIPWEHNLLIAVVTTTITLLALVAGRHVRTMLPPGLPDMVGGILLIALAAWSFYRERTASLRALGKRSAKASGSRVLVSESLFLAGALSANNIGLAIGEGIGGVGYSSAATSIFCFSVVMLALGQAVGGNVGLRRLHHGLGSPASGNGVLALAGLLMLAGY
jgi:putative Mn2+ efflux pump MntP